ncbi:FMN reductase [Burkholderia lata]|uniref:FMN reductase n=1 Tax=Burkholderia lata (strain ATCC 17760 / DSM 23089 / LMG 22485 / NCIMB 9086 / R18194 / 383) TaxID=482957 RepID=A0A6P2SPU0_BURL3|nr:NADPH-dependent FMN reductase [Burkholderia lata]VWC52412.1 FMN reductase [Burkholderia lata]
MANEPQTDSDRHLDIVALCGSLRAQSYNAALLDAAALVAPRGMRIVRFDRLDEFPLFNPDVEFPSPAAVRDLIDRVNAADGLLIASPEYAHGVTGVMKNALDWIVGCEAVVYKPVAVLNASPRATHADAALRETLSVMSARIVEPASITLPILGSELDAAGIAAYPPFASALIDALHALHAAIAEGEPSP